MAGRTPAPSRRAFPLLLLVSLSLVGVIAVLAFVFVRSSNGDPGVAGASGAPHFVEVDAAAGGQPERVVVIAGLAEVVPHRSARPEILMTNLVEGVLPERATTARVLTDTNCAPDAEGVSHCLNQLDIDGTLVTVQHHHKMSEVPCLTPGEVVAITTLAAYVES